MRKLKRILKGQYHVKYFFTIFTILLFTSSIVSASTALGIIDSPKKQMENGISAEDVLCKNDLQLMLRINGDAICVKPTSSERLMSLGLAEIVDVLFLESVDNLESNMEDATLVTDTNLSDEKIVVNSEYIFDNSGSMIVLTGTAQPNLNLEISLEDFNGNEIYADILKIDNSGHVYFEIILGDSLIDGEYFLILKQKDDSEIIPVLIGEPTTDIAVVIEKFHFDLNSQAILEIFGPSSANLSLTILDSRNHIQLEDTINLEPTGYAEYLLDLSGYKKGIYTVETKYATERTDKKFTVGLRLGTTPIEIVVDDDNYNLGETITLIGESTPNAQILIELIDSGGKIIHKIDHYTNDDGKFMKIVKIPFDKQAGTWKIQASNAERIAEINFEVIGNEPPLIIQLDTQGPYTFGDYVTISGSGIASESQAIIQIKSSEKLFELIPHITSDGKFSSTWLVPDYASGVYQVLIKDDINQATTQQIIIE